MFYCGRRKAKPQSVTQTAIIDYAIIVYNRVMQIKKELSFKYSCFDENVKK